MQATDERVDVITWDGDDATSTYHDEVWAAWLHGSVAAVHDNGHENGHLVLLVPVAHLTPAAAALARRLYDVGSVTLLD